MDLTAYKRIQYKKFMGLYKNGLGDNCPETHSPACQDVIFTGRGEVMTRAGAALSLNLTHTVKRFFLSTISDVLIPLTLDDTGHIYKGTDASPLLTVSGMTDFVGLNIFNKTYILPIGGSSNYKVWDGTNAVRDAAGLAPVASVMTAADGIAGNIDVGDHRFAVSYVTNTGFTTPPGPKVTGNFSPTVYTAPGGKKVVISNIPIGPTGTIQRIILATKSNLGVYYFAPGGVINDNTTTTVTLSFFDTDLTVEASYLFDLLEVIPGAVGPAALDKFHGRAVLVNTQEDLVRLSRPGEPEAFDNVTGFIQIPSERDGNSAQGTFQLRDVLYFTKPVGIFSTSDNLGEPSTWPIFPIDGGCGGVSYGVSSITGAQGHLTANDIALIADLNGLFYFDGVVRRPPLTYNIDDVWKQYVTIDTIAQVTVFIDPFSARFYVSVGGMPSLLVGDFQDGLSFDRIKWTQWNFPLNIKSISMASMSDAEFAYRLRISFLTDNHLYKYLPSATDDFGTAINSKYRLAEACFDDGAINVFRFVRFRGMKSVLTGTSNLAFRVYGEDDVLLVTPPVLNIAKLPGKEYAREINVMTEKAFIEFGMNGVTDGFKIQRVDVFGKPLFGARPA